MSCPDDNPLFVPKHTLCLLLADDDKEIPGMRHS